MPQMYKPANSFTLDHMPAARCGRIPWIVSNPGRKRKYLDGRRRDLCNDESDTRPIGVDAGGMPAC